MRFLTFILLLICTAFLACQNVEKNPKPKNLIPEDEMAAILVDMAKINAAISISAKEYEKRDEVGKDLIFEKYDIDSMQLVESNAYYAEDFKANQRIYEKVTEQLQKESDSLNKVEQERRKKKKEEQTEEIKKAEKP